MVLRMPRALLSNGEGGVGGSGVIIWSRWEKTFAIFHNELTNEAASVTMSPPSQGRHVKLITAQTQGPNSQLN